jgi:hypothetical protein
MSLSSIRVVAIASGARLSARMCSCRFVPERVRLGDCRDGTSWRDCPYTSASRYYPSHGRQFHAGSFAIRASRRRRRVSSTPSRRAVEEYSAAAEAVLIGVGSGGWVVALEAMVNEAC